MTEGPRKIRREFDGNLTEFDGGPPTAPEFDILSPPVVDVAERAAICSGVGVGNEPPGGSAMSEVIAECALKRNTGLLSTRPSPESPTSAQYRHRALSRLSKTATKRR